MSLFDRYILRDMLLPALAGTLVFVGVVMANVIAQSSEQIFALQTPPRVMIEWLLYRSPLMIVFGLPVGAMLGANLTVMRLGRDNEIVPFRLGGLSLRRFMRPFVVFGLLTTLLSVLVSEFLAPPALARADQLLAESILRQPDQVVKANRTFTTEGQAFCHVGEVNLAAAEMTFVLIYRFADGMPVEALAATRARLVDGAWQLEAGQHSTFDAQGQLVDTIPFEKRPVEFADNLVSLWEEDRSAEQTTLREGLERLRLYRASGDSLGAANQTYHNHLKIALPLSALIFVLLAAPLSLRFARPQSSPMTGILLTIVVVFFANGTINWAKVVALSGSGAWLSPEVAAWLHVVVFGALAIGLVASADR